jgi:uncharacterized protein YbcI
VSNDPGTPAADHLAGGQLNAAISNALVRIQREYLGRGPTKSRVSIRDDVVVVLMEDTLTKAEHSLVAAGRQEEVQRTRRSFQQTMRADITAAVEQLTGRKVIAFMSDTHIDPDIACEVLLLEPSDTVAGHLGEPPPT